MPVPARTRASRWGVALCLLHAVGAWAADIDWAWSMEAGQRTLTESSDTGARLVRERGPLARVRVGASLDRAGWPALAAQVALVQARLDYAGQTQGGQPVAATSRHDEAQWALMWRPLPPAAWGEGWLSLEGLSARRAIGSSGAAGGLVERSTLVLPGLRWRGPAWQFGEGGGATARFDAQWRVSVRHRLRVDYLGAYDGSALEGGRRQELALGVELATRDDWRWAARFSRAREPAGAVAAVYRAGIAMGTVRQPRTQIDELALSLTRPF